MTDHPNLETAPPLELLRAAIAASGLSDRQFAQQRLLRNERTLRRWLAGNSPIGREVVAWLRDGAGGLLRRRP